MAVTSELHVIVGAGPVGASLARKLVDSGHRVRVVTRSGRDLAIPGVESVALDASDHAALAASAVGATALYNCANPGSYSMWEKQWPPLAAALLHAAEKSGAILVTASNLYGYGRVNSAITRETPLRPAEHKGALRARMWEQALEAHNAGRVRVTEVRASDYIGPTLSVSNGILARYADATLRSRTATVFADPDQPHTWTAIDDVAATLAALGRDERAHGSAWIVPSNPPVSVREALRAMAERIGTGEPRFRQTPRWLLRAGGSVVPLLREVTQILYQFDAPFVADGVETTEVFGITPTPWESLLDETARAWAERSR